MNISPFEAISSHVERFKDTINTTLPCEVTSLELDDSGERIVSVSVKPFSDKYYKGDNSVMSRPEIYGVPLLFPSGDNGMFSFPVKVGDFVLVIFAQEDIDNFLAGNKGVPRTLRKFSYNDAIAIPCIHPHTSYVKPHKDNVELFYKETNLSIKPDGTVSLKTNNNVNVETTTDVNVTSQSENHSANSSYNVDTQRVGLNAQSVYIGNGSVDIVGYLKELTDEVANITVGGIPIDNKALVEALSTKISSLT